MKPTIMKKIKHHDHVGYPSNASCFNNWKQINIVHHNNQKKERKDNHVIISEAVNAFEKIPNPIDEKKKISKLKIEENIFIVIKVSRKKLKKHHTKWGNI